MKDVSLSRVRAMEVSLGGGRRLFIAQRFARNLSGMLIPLLYVGIFFAPLRILLFGRGLVLLVLSESESGSSASEAELESLFLSFGVAGLEQTLESFKGFFAE